jgi:two-component system, LuxR family, sensor kinase FixL
MDPAVTQHDSQFASVARDVPSALAGQREALRRQSELGFGVVFLAAYVLLERLSALHELDGLPITPWNPGLGVAFALIILRGPRYGWLLLAGLLMAEVLVLQSNLSWRLVLAIGVTLSVCYTAAALVTRQRLDLRDGLAHVRDVVAVLAGGVFGAIVAAVLLILLLLAFGDLGLRNVVRAAVPLFVGDTIGIAVMTPLILRAVLTWRSWSREAIFRLTAEVASLALIIAGLLVLLGVSGTPGIQRFQYALFLPVVAAAIYRGIDGACLALFTIQVVLVAVLFWYGIDAPLFTEYQMLMLVLTMTGLLVGVVVTEREAAARAARMAERRLEALQQEAARASRLNLLSGMASALAHEINQPLTAARALARSVQHLLKAPAVDLPRTEGNLASMMVQVDHASDVVRRMRDFLRRGAPSPSKLDVSGVIEASRALIEPECKAQSVTLEIAIDHGLPPVLADRVQLQQVVLNLVRNGMESIVEAGRTDGTVRLRVLNNAATDHILVCVQDNGMGISSDQAATIFEPLNSTKDDGLGLGLSISMAIVESHGGKLWLERSAPGDTEFRFSLPHNIEMRRP